MNACPRCSVGSDQLRIEYQGKENGVTLWTVYHCMRCSYTWRGTEPPNVIDPAQRPSDFKTDPSRLDTYPYSLPPQSKG